MVPNAQGVAEQTQSPLLSTQYGVSAGHSPPQIGDGIDPHGPTSGAHRQWSM
jgi:hypothetical protein